MFHSTTNYDYSITMHHSPTNFTDLDHHKSAFRRVPPLAMLSPPELLHDSEEDDEDTIPTPRLFRPISTRPTKYDQTGRLCIYRPKATPYRSPSIIDDALQQTAVDQSVVFQLNVQRYPTNTPKEHAISCTPTVICGESLLTALRKRVAAARHNNRNRMTPGRPKHAATRIRIPKTRNLDVISASSSSLSSVSDSGSEAREPSPEPEPHHTPQVRRRPWLDDDNDGSVVSSTSHHSSASNQSFETQASQDIQKPRNRKKPVSPRPTHPTSGRPSRVKGPCQACQETSDGCMRKAFDWPFPATSVFNDKGRPFVYLCNKCGLRYNKSGGSVCRCCRWVFCKEEKRKAMQHIDQMRKSRPDGRVDPDEDIEHFVCTPKYWTCGQPWKVGWVLNNLVEDDCDEGSLGPGSSL
ncbi:hypothetical protein CLU79DRAFT_743047 [Phycomyces nitens]|nr:hypothetical protein CLU79DRAFT_743047 [Phycomyces nitens]